MSDSFNVQAILCHATQQVAVDLHEVQEWNKSNDPKVLPVVAWLFTQHNSLFSGAAFKETAIFLIHLLGRDSVKEHGLSLYERLQYMGAIFLLLWKHFPDSLDVLLQLKSELASLAQDWPDANADLVVLVVLEHILSDKAIRNFFDDWNHDPHLQPVLQEGLRLSEGWAADHKSGRD